MTIAKTPADVQNAIDNLYGEREVEPARERPNPIARAVAQAAQQLQHIHEGELDANRLTAAGDIVLGQGVTLHLDGSSAVQSGKRVYSQRDRACSCPDHQHRQSYCKHLMAVDLYQLAQSLLSGKPASDAPEPATAPSAAAWGVTEAPVSCYFKLKIGHLELSYTMRDVSDDRMVARINEMLPKIQRYEDYVAKRQAERQPQPSAPQVPQTPPAPLVPPAEIEAPVCPYHGAMRASNKAPGTWFCPSKMADGSYCKTRWPQA